MADDAELEYEAYVNSDEYADAKNSRLQERQKRLAMMDLMDISGRYRVLMDYEDEDPKEVQLRKRAQVLRAQADQKRQRETWENIDALVAEADAAYETYIHSPEYAAWQLTQEKQAMDAIAQRGITQAPAGSPYGAAGQQVQPGSNANAVAEELKAKAEYYHNIQQQKKEQLQLEKDMRVLSWWSDEDQSALKQYIAIKKAQGSSMMMDPIFEGKRVDWLAVEDLKKRKGTSTVERMAESYIRAMNQEKMETVQEKALADANSGILGGTAASLKSVGANLLGSVTGIGGYLAEMTYRTGAYETLDPNNMGMMPSVYAGAVRQQAGQNIENSGFGKAGATVYQAGMSALDNLARLVAGGGAGSLALAATGSFSQAVQDYSRQGRTPVEAVTMGIINGGLEVLTEKMSLDNILTAMENPKTGMEILKAALKAGAIEVSEEELSLLGSTLAEAMVLRERSGYQQQVAMLTAMGLPEALAREQASRGVIDEAVQTAVQSFLSGGFMSGGTTAYANVQNKIQSRRDGQRLQETVQEAKAALEQKYDRDQVLPDTAAPAGQKPQQPAKTAPIRATPGGTVTIRDGANVTREQLEQVEKISSFTGRQIELYQAESENEEGWYDTNTGVLHIAASEKNPDARVIAHELTHSVETAPMYQELSSLVMARIQKTGGNLEQLRQKKRDLYARNGITLENLDDIDREIVAGYVAEHLLTSEAEIMSLSTENPGIARKILNWLNDLLGKMGNANAQERTFIRKARDAYAKALEQTGAPLRDDAGKSVRQLKARKTATEEQHRKGEISEEDLDAFYDEYNREMEILGVDPMAAEDDRFRKRDRDEGRDEVMRYFEEAYRNGDISKEEYDALVKEVGDGVRFSFAGGNAETADLDALSRAMDMEKQGHDAENIRQNTGWFRGMDKKWRFEIDDSKMKYQRRGDLGFRERVGSYDRYRKLIEKAEDFMLGKSNAWLTEPEQAELTELQKTWSESFRKEGQISPSARPSDRLSDYLSHDELFKAYPQLKDARLLFDELESGTKGKYDGSSNIITLSINLRSAPENTLIHEIQHAIQKIEGFTPGASVEYWKEQRRDIVETIAAARRNLDLWLEDIGYPEARQKSLLAASRREKTMDQHWKDMAEFKAESKYARQIAACEAELAEFQRQYDEITHGMTAYEQYENTAGEIEARDVSTRRSMDAEGRKKTPPILGGEDTVFAENSVQYSFADKSAQADITARYQTTVDQVLNMQNTKQDHVVIGYTPNLYENLGMPSLPFVIGTGHIYSAAKTEAEAKQDGNYRKGIHYHGLGDDVVKNIYEKLKDPIMIIASKDVNNKSPMRSTHSVVAIVDVGNAQKSLLLPIEITAERTVDGVRMDVNALSSIYEKSVSNLVNEAIALENTGDVGIYYAKKEALTLPGAGVQFPVLLQRSIASNSIIHRFPEKVNMGIVDATQSQQFKRWFGDWQNTPQSASKVVDEFGKPLVMYHGTRSENGEFYEFDESKAIRKGGLGFKALGKGNYFTSKKLDGTERYGARVIPAYLDIKKPFVYKNGKRFAEQVADELGIDSELGYDAMQNEMRQYGYDGVIQYDAEGRVAIAVTFDSTQIKSATENIGTFDRTNPDIRYSINDDADKNTSKSQAPAITRESLVGKARDNLKSAERQLHFDMSKAVNAPLFDKRESLKPFVEELTGAFMKDGGISEEKASEIFDRMIEESIDVSREFYRKHSDVYDQLRKTDLRVGEDVRKEFPGFDDFRRRTDRYKTIRIVDSGGTSIADAYKQARVAAPELFPSNLTHPVDQLTRLFNVCQSIGSSGFNVENRDGDTWEAYKRTMKGNLFEALWEASEGLRTTRRYAQEREAEKAARENQKKEITVEEAGKLWEDLKTYRKAYQKISAKTLLTAHDEMQVGRLLRGEITLEHLANEENFDGIEAVYRAKAEYEKVNKQLKRYKAQIRAARLADADRLLETANTWIDKKTGIAYSRETMRRNVLDIVKDKSLAQEILQEYFEPVQISQASATRFKNLYRDRVRELKLSDKVEKGNKVSEAYAVQLLGEAMDNMEMISKSRGRIKTRDGMDLEEWQGMLDELWAENPKLDAEKIQNAVTEFRKIYDELFQEMNRVRLENGYEPVNYRKGYFPHFQSENGDSIIDYFGKTFGINTSVEALPTTINGLTHTFKPGIQWFGHAQERKGFQTTYDALQGFDKYIEGVANVIYQTDNIQKLRAFATQARYRTSDEGLRAQVDRVNANPELTEEEKMAQIKDIFENGRYSLSNFVVELDEYTNILAGKKSKYDRTMESLMGRRAYTVMKNIESKVGANMIAGNLGSALTNFIPLTQAAARISPKYMLKGVKDAAKAVIGKDGFVAGMSDFLTNRRGTDALVKGWQEKLSGVLGTPMELIDNLVSESIVRAAYYQNQARGLSDSEAMHQADIFAAGVMADRSKGALPTVFESSNPIFKALTQFQVEVNNQYSEVFKDIPREYADRAKWVLAACFFKYFIGAFLWNKLEEELRGRASAMDPIGIAENFIQDWRTVGFGDSVANLTVNVLEELPFTSALALLGMDIDAGRIPVSSAMPDIPGVWDALTDKDMAGEKRYKTLTEELQKPITYLLMPAGGNQAAKTWKGLKAFFEGGSYSIDGDGQEILQYPVYKDFWEMARATVFGKSATKGGREWVEDGFDSFNAKQTALYKDLKEAGADEKEAYRLIDEIRAVKKGAEPDATKVQKDARLKLIREAGLSEECKDVVYYGLVANEAEREFMDTLSDAGVEKGLYKFTADFMDAKQQDGAARKDALRDVIQGAPLTEAEKQIAVAEILGDKEVGESGKLTTYGKFVYAKQYGLTADEFMDMYANGTDIDDYLELREGNVAADSAKELATALGALELSNLSSTEKWNRQCDTILNSGVSEEEKVTALVNVSYESTGRMIQIGYDNGISPELCVALKKILPSYDANSNGNYSQAEVQNAIDAISGSEVYLAATGGKAKLTNEQKAMLWQLSNKSWKYWKNPYDKDVGQRISELMAVYGEKQPELADTFAEEVQKQILGK